MRRAKVLLGLAISAGLVYLIFRETDWRAVAAAFAGVRWGWFWLAQLPIWGAFFLRVLRWRCIVRACGPVGLRPLYSATAIGFLGNTLLPARLGELLRPLALSRLAPFSFSQALALNALDRTADVVGLLAVMLVSALALPGAGEATIPAATFGTAQPIRFDARLVTRGAQLAAALLLGLVAGVVALYAARERAGALVRRLFRPARLGGWLADRIDEFAAGLAVLRSGRDLLGALLLSLAVWGSFILAWACALQAFGLAWPWYAPFVIHALTQIAISVPGAPGFVGQFHVPVVVGLVLLVPGATPDGARAVALVAHLCNVLPLLLLGWHALVLEGLRLGELRATSC